MELQELRELRKVLPENHPIFEKLTTKSEESDEETYDPAASFDNSMLVSVVNVIDDWKRGIRDWMEVERILVEARSELQFIKE